MLAHNVYFTLYDGSEDAKRTLVEACRTHLPGHAGVIFFACGTREKSLERPVNDRDFDVSLHMLFTSKADHDAYQEAPGHMQFVAENQARWKLARVFDSEVERLV
ncbi:MAG TPA: Dabb family protein [Isosphaeraceae bacterium]|jgi:hypothetical protein|nr:Dabb family protein [Isosphaeraceae bacterium]